MCVLFLCALFILDYIIFTDSLFLSVTVINEAGTSCNFGVVVSFANEIAIF